MDAVKWEKIIKCSYFWCVSQSLSRLLFRLVYWYERECGVSKFVRQLLPHKSVFVASTRAPIKLELICNFDVLVNQPNYHSSENINSIVNQIHDILNCVSFLLLIFAVFISFFNF